MEKTGTPELDVPSILTMSRPVYAKPAALASAKPDLNFELFPPAFAALAIAENPLTAKKVCVWE
jgi:hypothetical protein